MSRSCRRLTGLRVITDTDAEGPSIQKKTEQQITQLRDAQQGKIIRKWHELRSYERATTEHWNSLLDGEDSESGDDEPEMDTTDS